MEVTGRDGGRGSSWSYRREETTRTSSCTISSSSGTITTTYTSSASRIMSSLSMEPAMHSDLRIHDEDENVSLEESKKVRMKHIQSLVQEFFGSSSANRSMAVLERWFTELGVPWVLHFAAEADGASAGEVDYAYDARSWIRALAEIMQAIHLTTSPVQDETYFPQFSQEIFEGEPETTESGKQLSRSDQFQNAQFFQQTMLKMLGFVDVIAHEKLVTNGVPVPQMKLSTLLHVHVALSTALSQFQFRLHWPPYAEVKRIQSEMVSMLSAKEDKACAAVWSTLEEIRTRVLESTEDLLGTQTPPASSGIHMLTWSVMAHITFLFENFRALAPDRLRKYVPQTGDIVPLDSMIMEMTSSLEEKLVSISESFPNRGLAFLFLLNNFDFMEKRFQRYPFPKRTALTCKVESYIESYLQVSWAPVVSCLFNPTPLAFWKKYSRLHKFEYEFQKTYITQKLWKVPHPELRNTLRIAITRKIAPGYTKYMEDNKVTTPKFTLKVLEEMLQELFEGS